MSDLFIPEKIRVGFQKREDTYTGRLAYVIYYDAKGKLRKEKSWEDWRDKKIEPVEFANKPTGDFHLNKGIQRFNWGHFGSNRSYIRVFDSRGIEFEITPENLIGILTETDCSRRGLGGEFVYAWKGVDLVLLPCCSQEYKEAVKHTERQSQKISARDLKPGCSYTTKKGEEVIYIGRFNWFKWDWSNQANIQISEKQHIFADPSRKKDQFFPKDATFLATLNSAEPVADYADLVDKWNANPRSSTIQGWEDGPLRTDADHVFNNRDRREYYTQVDGDNVHFFSLCGIYKSNWGSSYLSRRDEKPAGFRLVKVGTLNRKTMVYRTDNNRYRYGYGYSYNDVGPVYDKDEIMGQLSKFSKVVAIMGSGKKLEITEVVASIMGNRYW